MRRSTVRAYPSTQTDPTWFQATSAAQQIRDAAIARGVEEMATVTARSPQRLVQLVGGQSFHEAVTRRVTVMADTVKRRLPAMPEAAIGPPPLPTPWLARGSQEQTGVSDKNIWRDIHDDATDDDRHYPGRVARQVTPVVECAGARPAMLTKGAKIDEASTLVGAERLPSGKEDPFLKATCKGS